jgi:DNA-binding MarR family transcriptional regulator
VVEITNEGRALLAQLRQARRDSLAELLNALSPEDEVTLGLAMRVAAPLLDELTNVAVNGLPSKGSEPGRASGWSLN